jgi:hypothetical protein
MGWVLKSWRTEWLDARASSDARRRARETVLRAEREARALSRAAAREVADAEAYLEILRQLGVEAHRLVDEQRRALGAASPAPHVSPTAREPIADEPRPAGRTRTPRRRATLRESPLTELFRATSAA